MFLPHLGPVAIWAREVEAAFLKIRKRYLKTQKWMCVDLYPSPRDADRV